MLHEAAFTEHHALINELKRRLGEEFCAVVASASELSSQDAVQGYAFNSQLVTLPNNQMQIIAPQEAAELAACRAYLERVVDEVPQVAGITYVPVRQSMSNGGGPACLRLRVPLNPEGLAAMSQPVFASGAILDSLENLIRARYRDRVTQVDLSDPQFARESLETYVELMQLLGLEAASHAAQL